MYIFLGHKNLKKLYQFVNHEKMPYEPLMSTNVLCPYETSIFKN
jgi:hypothetical protein